MLPLLGPGDHDVRKLDHRAKYHGEISLGPGPLCSAQQRPKATRIAHSRSQNVPCPRPKVTFSTLSSSPPFPLESGCIKSSNCTSVSLFERLCCFPTSHTHTISLFFIFNLHFSLSDYKQASSFLRLIPYP